MNKIIEKKVSAQILHHQFKLLFIATASIFYSEELFHQELSYHLKKWPSGISFSFSCPKFFTINSNWFILHLHQYSTLRNYFIRNSPITSKNDQAGFLSVFHVLAFLHSSTASPQLNDRHSFITNHFRTTQNSNYWSKFSKWVHF